MCTVTLTLFVLESRCVESNGFLILPVDSQRLTGVAPKIGKSTEGHKRGTARYRGSMLQVVAKLCSVVRTCAT